MRMQMQLANPALIFIYSLVLLLFGCGIGMHWNKSPEIASWIAVCARHGHPRSCRQLHLDGIYSEVDAGRQKESRAKRSEGSTQLGRSR